MQYEKAENDTSERGGKPANGMTSLRFFATVVALAVATSAITAALFRPDAGSAEARTTPAVAETTNTTSTTSTATPDDSTAPTVIRGETEQGDTEQGDTVQGETEQGDTAQGEPGQGDLDGSWSTVGARIVDGDGDEVQIRGVNWFGFETANGAPHGLWQRDLDEMLDQIAALGFNTIRLPFAAEMLDATEPVQGVDAQSSPDLQGLTSLELMDEFIDRAGERGLAIVLDRHALGYDNRHHLWFDDRFPHERLAADWVLLAERYGDVPNVIGADLYNEPHDQACWGCGDPALDWKAAAEEAADALHEVDADWLVFVEGVEQPDGANCDGPDATSCTWWGGNLSQALEQPIEIATPNKVVYSPHEYATSVFRQPWFDDPAFPANLAPIWDENWGELAHTDTAPVMVGEFGTTLDSEIDAVWLEALLAYMDANGIGFTFWTFNPNSGDTGGVLEDDWVTVDTEKFSYLEPYLVGPFPPT